MSYVIVDAFGEGGFYAGAPTIKGALADETWTDSLSSATWFATDYQAKRIARGIDTSDEDAPTLDTASVQAC